MQVFKFCLTYTQSEGGIVDIQSTNLTVDTVFFILTMFSSGVISDTETLGYFGGTS